MKLFQAVAFIESNEAIILYEGGKQMNWDMNLWLEKLTQSKQKKALPIMTYPGLSLIDKNVREIITSGEDQYICIAALSKRYPAAAALTIMDLSVEPEAFGSKIKYSDNEVPSVVGRIISGMEDARQLQTPKVGAGRTAAYLQAARLAAQNITDRPVLAGQIGPFSLAGRMMDMTEIMITMMEEPEMVHTVLEKCTDFLIEYAKAFKENGANGVIIAEPAAGLLSPEKCAEFSSQYLKKIVRAVQDPHFTVVLHNCGNTVKLVDTMVSTEAKCFHFGNAVKMTDIMPQIPADRIAFGNIDPAGVFKNGTIAEMQEKVKTLLEDMRPYHNFVISSGCDIPPETPLENVEAFFQALSENNA
jgi:uroporphyrinogen decarboxylase